MEGGNLGVTEWRVSTFTLAVYPPIPKVDEYARWGLWVGGDRGRMEGIGGELGRWIG